MQDVDHQLFCDSVWNECEQAAEKVLIFDEPTSGLDYRHMLEVGRVIRSLAEQGHIILVVSHDKEFMQTACDRLLEIGPPKMEDNE